MKKIFAFTLLCCSSVALADPAVHIDQPEVKSNDTWTYQDITEKGTAGWHKTIDTVTVENATSSKIYFDTKQDDSTQPPLHLVFGADWSRTRDVNGQQTVVNQPFSFPLTSGKSWSIQYAEQHPRPTIQYEKWNTTYKVIGREDIEVPAGKFRAIKIEAEGQWEAEAIPQQSVVQGSQSVAGQITAVSQIRKTDPTPKSGRVYRVFWYVPEVKRWVKSVEDYYNSNDVRDAHCQAELMSYKVN